MSRRGLYTIAPHAPFLPLLADRVLDGTLLAGWDLGGPFGLADVTILLPTRRARLVLAELFAARLGGAALLPDIRALGGEAPEEEPFLPPLDAPVAPPEAGRLERRLTLSRLVRQFALGAGGFATPPNAPEILALAESLGELIDDLAIEGVPASALESLVPADLAGNWQEILDFLDIVLKAWPAILAGRGRTDAAVARNERLRRQAATLPLLHGDRPVIAAGSTGSIPATAELLKAIAALPRGALVLPGLDTTLTPDQHRTIIEDDNTDGHAQYGLARLLRGLGAGIADVEELAGDAPRTRLVRTALALADETRHWPAQRGDVAAALAGVSVLAAPNADLEARAIALRARQALADGETVGIVTRDQMLARRIAMELDRHGIAVDDPAGTPLYHSPAGRLVRQVLALAASQFAPIDLIALLRNGAVTLGASRAEIGRLSEALDLALRGQRPLPGLAGIVALTTDEAIAALLGRLGEAVQPLTALMTRAEIDARLLAEALAKCVEALIGEEARLPGLAEFGLWAADIAGLEDAGAPFAPVTLDGVLAGLMAGLTIADAQRRRDDIHIWGELEARLMSPDLMILAGVNEDVWPAAADPGPWLSRGMRIGIGLAPPERRQGQAAHDFAMAMGNRTVMLAYAERLGTAPALPSRLVQRLDALVGRDAAEALRRDGGRWLAMARALDFAGPPRPAQRPLPKPPAALRPRRLSITEIETLIRSPYDLYARHVLRLRRRDPLGAAPEARERGTMIHEIFARFVTHHDVMAPDAPQTLMTLARDAFAGLDGLAEKRDIWLERFARTAEQFLEFERARDGEIARRHAERKGELVLALAEPFVLSGRADRLDLRHDGRLEILDFKTGTIPSARRMRAFDAPQLLLEAAMAREGAFAELGRRDTEALTYIKIGLGPAAFVRTPFRTAEGMALDEMVDAAFRRAQGHIEALLLTDTLPLAARIRPDLGQRFAGDYDHLARTDEWTLTAGADE